MSTMSLMLLCGLACSLLISAYSQKDTICPNGIYCPDGDTCCANGCCPSPNANCCPDGSSCCPSGTTCGPTKCYGSFLGDTKLVFKLKSRDDAKAQNIICPDQTKCGNGQTCCAIPGNKYGCCFRPGATCCSDGTCCPNGYTCGPPGDSHCYPPSGDATQLLKLTATVKRKPTIDQVDDILCPDAHTCPIDNTCCPTDGRRYGCCPQINATCCSDLQHCCPQGQQCAGGGLCSQSEKTRPAMRLM